MLIIIIILTIINLSLIIILFLSRRESDYILRQLKERKDIDTNALLHMGNGFFPRELLQEINLLLRQNRSNQAYYAHKKHELYQMMTNISHDLRTPLTSVVGYIDIILNTRLPAEEKYREIKIVEQRLGRLEELINSFFEFSQIIARENAPEKRNLKLIAILEESIAHYYNDYCAKDRSITLHCEKTNWIFFSNKNMLLRIFDNLIGNSLKHGVGELIISVQLSLSSSITIKLKNALSSPSLDLSQIFDEFYTTDISRTSGNTGLGLAIAKQFTQMLVGEISASYEKALFVITIIFPCSHFSEVK